MTGPSRRKQYPAWLGRWLHEPREVSENIAFFKERQWMRRANPDCVIVRYAFGRASGGLAAQQTATPWILQVDAPYELESRHLHYYWRLPGVNPWIERRLLRTANALVLVSREAFAYYRDRGVPPGKMLIVPNGVNPERFRPDLDGQPIRRRWGLDGRCVVGFVGGFYPWHGIEGLAYLMEELLPRCPELAMLLVGDGPERPRLEQLAVRLRLRDRVVFTGPIDHKELPPHLASMDIAIAPYPPIRQFYFSPMKLFEYLASGLPVVAAAIGQVGEVIRDGENGLLAAPGDWRAFAQHVERLSGDVTLRQRCAHQARQTVLQHFTWRRVAEQVMALAGRVASHTPNPARGL